MAESATERLAQEFDALIALSGLTIPAERRGELLTAFADLRAEIARLYATPLAPTLEPARVYRPLETTREASVATPEEKR